MASILQFSHREFRTFVTDAIGVQYELPVIVTDNGVLDQFARYINRYRNKSRSWQESSTFAVQLLLEYMEVNQRFYDTPQALFREFSDALYSGTVSKRWDPSGLWWQKRQSADASKLIKHITHFTDWLSQVGENTNLQLNPWREATRHEERLNWAAYLHRRDNSFLSHLMKPTNENKQSRHVRSRTSRVERQTPVKNFPEEYFDLLLSEGFRRRARDSRGPTDLRNVLITYLMHYGGLRLSEALSLWSDDVSFEGNEVIVRVYHPEEGLAPDRKSNRTDYLQRKYGLQPRKRLVKASDPLFLGWKESLITDPHRHCFEVFFYHGDRGQDFARLWLDYHRKQRVKPKAGEDHPYAFTNQFGQPYSHKSFRKAHKLAVERIGLDYHKMAGTTPHGHRHAFGQRLARDGASQLTIRNAMHHVSLESSLVYTQPTATQIRKELQDLEGRMRLRHAYPDDCLPTKD